jgi:hypothetical protein
LYDQLALAAEFDRRAGLLVRNHSLTEPEFCSHIGVGQRLENLLSVDAWHDRIVGAGRLGKRSGS